MLVTEPARQKAIELEKRVKDLNIPYVIKEDGDRGIMVIVTIGNKRYDRHTDWFCGEYPDLPNISWQKTASSVQYDKSIDDCINDLRDLLNDRG